MARNSVEYFVKNSNNSDVIIIIVSAIAYQRCCVPRHDHVAERLERSLVFLPASYTSAFRFHLAPLCASPLFVCLYDLLVLFSLSINSPKYVEPKHSYKSFKKPTIKPCPEPVQSNAYIHNPFPNICFSITYGQVSQAACTLSIHLRERCVRA